MSRPILAFLTDFGLGWTYVAQMKAVALEALETAELVDVTHAIPAQSVRTAELALRSVAFRMPVGTVFVVVVDPGVGTQRRPIAIRAAGRTFVGPDNGVLAIAARQPGARAVVLDRQELHRTPVSPTFHGRDIFTPVASELAAGVALDQVGSSIAVTELVDTTLPHPVVRAGQVRGEVVAVDDFGNLLTNVATSLLGEAWQAQLAEWPAQRVSTYHEGPSNCLLALAGSDGHVEYAVRDGSAKDLTGADVGTAVVCWPPAAQT